MHGRADNCLTIDVAAVRDVGELHQLLYSAFQFPNYYGRNWMRLTNASETCQSQMRLSFQVLRPFGVGCLAMPICSLPV